MVADFEDINYLRKINLKFSGLRETFLSSLLDGILLTNFENLVTLTTDEGSKVIRPLQSKVYLFRAVQRGARLGYALFEALFCDFL